MFFTNKQSLLMFVSFMVFNTWSMFYDPTLANQLVEHDLTIAQSGLGFGCIAFWMMIFSPIFSKMIPKFGRRPVFFLSLVISVIGVFLLGPSKVLNLPDESYIMFIGLSLIGTGMGGVNPITIPEICPWVDRCLSHSLYT